MFRRLRLPGKLALAALPMVALLVAAATYFTLQALDAADQEEFTAELAETWVPLQAVIDALAAEERATLDELDALADQDITAMRGASDLDDVRGNTDAALAALRADLGTLGGPAPMVSQYIVATDAVTAVRAFFDESGTSPDTQRIRIPEGYDLADAQILEIGDFIVAEVSDVDLARDLAAIAALSRALQAASIQDRTVALLDSSDRLATSLEAIRSAGVEVSQYVAAYESAATERWGSAFRDSDVGQAIFDASRFSGEIVRSGGDPSDAVAGSWADASERRRTGLIDFRDSRIDVVVDSARRGAAAVRQQAFTLLGVVAAAVVAAAALTALVSRSIVRRVRTVTESARNVSQTQLPALVEALRDPSEDVVLPSIPPIRDRGADEVGDLARSFSAMQSTLEHVATQQIEVLRKGVADMFVTLARRNRSLIDRQLSMIDELEQKEEDPDALANFYQLDHLATRMRRNAESLLVLAGSEPPKQWRTALDIDDVVRAALGEVEDYRRIDVLALESVRLRGTVVADLAHLLSELLENATSYSPPETRVRVAGHFHDEGYLITVTDRGVGVSAGRLGELNALLSKPPVVGLALEPTLGLYVVAMLAKRHGVRVRLVSGAPGLTAHVMVPKEHFELEAASPSPAPRPRRSAEPAARPDAPPAPAPEPSLEPMRTARPATEPARSAEPERSPVSPVSAAGLPLRVPGRSGAPSEHEQEQREPGPSPVEDPVTAPSRPVPAASPNGSAPVATGRSGLPTRDPGASFQAPDVEERPVDTSRRDPQEIKSAFASFQLGTTVGRNSREEEGAES